MSESEDLGQRSRQFEYLELCGDSAQRWLHRFRDPQIIDMVDRTFSAVDLCRAHDLDSAHKFLERVHKRLEKLQKPPSMRHLLERWYLSARAYERYKRD